MSERIEILRQKMREEAAEAQLRRAHAGSLSKEPLPLLPAGKPKTTWWGAEPRKYGVSGGEIAYGGEVPPDRSPCPSCGVRADFGCRHRRNSP